MEDWAPNWSLAFSFALTKLGEESRSRQLSAGTRALTHGRTLGWSLLTVPLASAALLVLFALITPACSPCTSSATVYAEVVVTDSKSLKPSKNAAVTIDGRPCSYGGFFPDAYACPATDAEGTFEIVAVLNGQRAAAKVEMAASGCGGRSKAYEGTVRLNP